MPTFTATIEAEGPNGAWAMIAIPPAVAALIAGAARAPVRGSINGFQFRSSIMPRADGSFYMMVNKELRAGAGASTGDAVHVQMEQDDAPPVVEVPPELAELLEKNAVAHANFDAMPHAHRKEYTDWIAAAKQHPTRVRRAEKAVGALLQGHRLKR